MATAGLDGGIGADQDIHRKPLILSDLEKGLHRRTLQKVLHRTVVHRVRQNGEDLVIGGKQKVNICIAMRKTEIVARLDQNAAQQHFLHEKGFDLPAGTRAHILETEQQPGRLSRRRDSILQLVGVKPLGKRRLHPLAIAP